MPKGSVPATRASLLADPETVARLLILLLVKLGTDSNEIAAVLGVDSSRVRQLVPVSRIKKLKT